ncbi:hypothetical protein I545_1516 [Mycobacterium kansasii 662]|uniref:Uncharacterized protein n=3 Tax=Mycobacterium kansasii TaxID=1768 RepID=A0A1V3WIY6_MYCKA|nr:hypothetical protein MKAN_26535 [Mycobacterium kansasii ATCC 12478]EUA21972.1 hypothetical protein I545_1516 [Mycobacterium kansasii 662]KEP42469.1 hypothetical protein MKSMC1_23990 [Mycobacterium kansasii]OOK66241.1 hypothetical protein BZL29_7444 [Mycobacterium kansasii]
MSYSIAITPADAESASAASKVISPPPISGGQGNQVTVCNEAMSRHNSAIAVHTDHQGHVVGPKLVSWKAA